MQDLTLPRVNSCVVNVAIALEEDEVARTRLLLAYAVTQS